MTEIIYSTSRVRHKGGRRAVNPQFFVAPEAGVTKVHLNGDFPNVRAAYEAAGVEVVAFEDAPPAKKAAASSEKGS